MSCCGPGCGCCGPGCCSSEQSSQKITKNWA